MPNCKYVDALAQSIVKCIVQPADRLEPLIHAIDEARKSVEIVIFRFNEREIEHALANAVSRGVQVHALIANTNRGGEKNLRDLELRLLAAGVTVARTGDDLVRYHGKLMIVDRRVLILLAFNFTHIDIERSRSFGVITSNSRQVQEAVKLFEADVKRQHYAAGSSTFLVSPLNARKELAAFIRGAKKELLIYDPEVSDPAMIRALEARAKAGVTINHIGKRPSKSDILDAPKALPMRLHARAIVRDGTWAFIGSQSLRTVELDGRREAGIIFRNPEAVGRLAKTFHDDWEAKERPAPAEVSEDEAAVNGAESAGKIARKVAKAVANDLAPVMPIIESSASEIAGAEPHADRWKVEEKVKEAVKDAVKQAVSDLLEETAK
jgi:cardiolipin synthase A/B